MLKKPKPSQKGLKKLPTAVRNKMGYMKDGGSLGRGAGSLAEIIAAGPGGMGLTGTAKKVYDFAKKMKPSGRLNEDDFKRAKLMIMQGTDNPRNRMKGPGKEVMRTKSRVSAPQTKTLNRPKQSVFQQLKKAQMLRKHDGRGKK